MIQPVSPMSCLSPQRLRFASVFLLLFIHNLVSAQSCACNGTIQPSADENCRIVLTAASILSDFNDNPCPGPYSFELFSTNPDGTVGVSLGTSMDSLLITADRIGGTFIVMLNGSTNGCQTTVITEDKLPPTITCTDTTLVCNDLAGLALALTPVVSDNCSGQSDLDLNVSSTTIGPGCFPNDVRARVVQFLNVTDAAGNTTTCQRTISLLGIPFDQIDFAPDLTLDCGADASALAVSMPLFDGRPVGASTLCGLAFDTLTIFDSGINSCPRTIVRDIVLVDNCQSPGFRRDTQTVVIDDTTPPVLACPATLTIGNLPGQCFGTLGTLPVATATDDCDPDVAITTTTSFADPLQIPLGTQTITYTATDNCGNTATCSVDLVVTDTEGPTLICDQITQVSLNNQGQAVVPAAVFDDGSFDNCGGPLSFEVRRATGAFGPSVTFGCADVGQTIMVFLRATGTDGLSDVCMVEVLVDDKIAPQLLCPPSLTIECTDPINNLAIYGSPTVFEACGFDLTTDSTSTIDNCGTGLITRTFAVTDASGNTAACTQTITIINSFPFDGTGIVFPADVTIENACLSALSALAPDNLPVGSQRPVLPATDCTMLGTSFEDQLFEVNGAACFKIVRTWTVLDWCVFDAQTNPTGGIFTDQQIIKIIDTNAPVLASLPDTLEVDIDATCNFGSASLIAQATDDCATQLTISNDGPFGSGGADASGDYPAGITPVTFTANDGCGNQSSRTVIVNVVDNKAPTPQCIPTVITPIAEMLIDGDTMALAMIDATVFNDGSFDNCPGALSFFARPSNPALTDVVPATTQLTYTCANVGTNLVDFFVVDAAGNFDFCTVSVIIQDQDQLCGAGDPQVVTLGGQVACPDGTRVPGVAVELTNGNSTQTDAAGSYTLAGIPTGQSYTLVPTKTDDLLLGVSTYDLVLISQHILGVQPFTTPDQYLAADVNGSESISTLDIVVLRKAILYLIDAFPATDSYRFLPADFNFADPNDPWATPLPDSYATGMLYQPMQVDFRAIKVGDVSGARALTASTAVSRHERANLVVQDAALLAGERYQLRVRLDAAAPLVGAQALLRANGLSFEDLHSDYLTVEEYTLSQEAVRFSWLAEATPEENDWFVLTLRAGRSGQLSDMLRLDERFTAEGYSAAGIVPLELRFLPPVAEGLRVGAAQPNPFSTVTQIHFTLPQAETVHLTVIDAAGRTVYRREAYYPAGAHELRLRGTGLPKGLLFFRLTTATESEVLKLVHQ